jgi:hypothetical protein
MKNFKIVLWILVVSIVLINTVVISTSQGSGLKLSFLPKIASASGEGSAIYVIKTTISEDTSSKFDVKCPNGKIITCTRRNVTKRIECLDNGKSQCTPGTEITSYIFCPEC